MVGLNGAVSKSASRPVFEEDGGYGWTTPCLPTGAV